jgi:predicted DNA-binding transcriptional regulator AlpA
MQQHPISAPSAALCDTSYIMQLCAFSKSTLYNKLKAGEFPQPATRLGPRYTRWRMADVHAWAADPQTWIATNKASDEVAA